MKTIFSFSLYHVMPCLAVSILLSQCTLSGNDNDQSSTDQDNVLALEIYETSAQGHKLTLLEDSMVSDTLIDIYIDPTKRLQTITGFGGAFTESSAHLLNAISAQNRNEILEAYFGDDGARYSLCRTHMNSCDFSLDQYSYTPVENDTALEYFSIAEDQGDIIPMILDAQEISSEGFKLMASPWTAPPWMKDNKSWVGGRLLKEFYPSWAKFFSLYHQAYLQEGINVWGFTVENEPHGNGDSWESMLYSPEEMTDFVQHHLGPQLERDGLSDVVVLGYDQNRAGLKEWVDVMYEDSASSKYYDGTAVHWYESTYEVFPEALQYAKSKAPDKYLIETEACVDSEVPAWKDDVWYWSKEATDWGWDWASAEDKYLHPKYVPVYRYARDIIGCLNNQVDGWIDWNMVLDQNGGPNWFKNWCVAPILVDTTKDEVYYTPIYYTLSHFSRFIRPGAEVLETVIDHNDVMVTAAENPDGSRMLVVFNPQDYPVNLRLNLEGEYAQWAIAAQAIQTVVIPN